MAQDAVNPVDANTKYNRTLTAMGGEKVTVDIYRVLAAFEPLPNEIIHAIKKLLVPGGRAKASHRQDVSEAMLSLEKYLLRYDQEHANTSVEAPPMPPITKQPSTKW